MKSYREYIREMLEDKRWLYHGSDINNLSNILSEGFMGNYDDYMASLKNDHLRFKGLSTSRNLEFVIENVPYIRDIIQNDLIVYKFDADQIKQNYKIKQIHWFNRFDPLGEIEDKEVIDYRMRNDIHNEYEERIILDDKKLPIKYIKTVYCYKNKLEHVKNLVEAFNIEIKTI
jgi:hypothetical protein